MERWGEVDGWIAERLGPDAVLERVAERNRAAGLADIAVSPLQARFLALMVRIAGARRVLEIGTLGGYSTIAMARALPEGGEIVTLERDHAAAAIAAENFSSAGVGERIDLRVGTALETLPVLEGGTPFNLVFIDADKRNSPAYAEWAVELGRPGTVVIVDNVVRGGNLVDPAKTDPDTVGNRALFKGDLQKRMDFTVLQTVGLKGWDGLLIGIVR